MTARPSRPIRRLARMVREVAVVRAEERAAADPVSRKKAKPADEEQ